MAARINFLPCSWENLIAMRMEIYGCPGNIASFAFVQIKKRRIKSRLKNVQVRGGYLEYLRHFFFIALHTSFPPFAIFMHKWQHMSMPQQHENYTCTSLSENLKMFWETVSWNLTFMPRGLILVHLSIHPFIYSPIHWFIHLLSFINFSGPIAGEFFHPLLVLFCVIVPFFVSIRNGLSCKE